MSSIAAVGTPVPNFECDVDRILASSMDTVTEGRKIQKFAELKWIDVEVSKCPESAFADYVVGEDNIRDLFTAIDAISYEDVGSADRLEARQLNATRLTTVGVGLGYHHAQPWSPARGACSNDLGGT